MPEETDQTEETLLLKSDCAGRVRVPAEQREAMLDAFERSGASAAAFARHHGVKYPTFAGWVAARKRQRGEEKPRPIEFAEVVVGESRSGGSVPATPIRVALRGGAVVEISEVSQVGLVSKLILALSEPC